MKIPNEYIRVGIHYYKIVNMPFATGGTSKIRIPWNKDTIISDHGKKYCDNIPCYDGFCCIPSHTNYQEKIATFRNEYQELEHKPKEGTIDNTINFITHIFGSQLDMALDYLKIIYEHPLQTLPILCLVSEKRQTGKTTFLKWLKEIYASNMAYLDNQNIGSRFNSDWMGKVLVGVEEASVQNDGLIEILKNISTANRYNSESKGRDRVEVDMFLKIVLCSNRETNLLRLDGDEIRFWIVKVPTLTSLDVNLLTKLIKEIPAFLHYLINRPLNTPEPQSRMWFSAKQIETPALRKMKLASKNKLELDLATALYTAMEDLGIEEVKLTPNDALQLVGKNKSFLLEIRRILKNTWKLVPQDNTNSYERLYSGDAGYILLESAKGRYYSVTKNFIESNFDDLMN